jgi:hypothetical protein
MQSGQKIGLADWTPDGFVGLGKCVVRANKEKTPAEDLKVQR